MQTTWCSRAAHYTVSVQFSYVHPLKTQKKSERLKIRQNSDLEEQEGIGTYFYRNTSSSVFDPDDNQLLTFNRMSPAHACLLILDMFPLLRRQALPSLCHQEKRQRSRQIKRVDRRRPSSRKAGNHEQTLSEPSDSVELDQPTTFAQPTTIKSTDSAICLPSLMVDASFSQYSAS